MQIALQTPPLLIAGGDDPLPRAADLDQLVGDLGLQPGDLDRESGPGQDVAEELWRWSGKFDHCQFDTGALYGASREPVVGAVGGAVAGQGVVQL